MAKKRIVKDKDGKQVEIDQDAIDAALAGAVSPVGGHPQPRQIMPKLEKTQKDDASNEYPKDCVEKESDRKDDAKVECEPQDSVEETNETGSTPIAMSYEDFGRKCFNLDINAKQCNYQSNKSKDKSIDEYLRGINKKIYDEVRTGGYSTNIQFRVAPNDYVNVNHIIDWYRARGFQILNYAMASAPYGNNAGMIEYNFTISWVEA